MKLALYVAVFATGIFYPLYGQKYLGNSWASIKANGSGTLTCIYHESPGLIYRKEDKVKGVCVDILGDFVAFIQEQYSITVKLDFVPETKGIHSLLEQVHDTPNALGIATTSITNENKKDLAFSPFYLSNPMVLLTGREAPSLNSLPEIALKFEEYTAVVVRNSWEEEYLRSTVDMYYPLLKIEYEPNSEAVLDKIISTPNTFTLIDFMEFFKSIKKRLPVKRHEVTLEGPVKELGFVMQKGSDWLPLWNEFLTPGYRESMRYKKIVATHLGNSFFTLSD